jgi:hypothetical protein
VYNIYFLFYFLQVEKLGEMKSGSFVEDRYNDTLSASIGKPEHPERLRGHSQGYVTIKDVYGKGKRQSDTNHDSCNKRFKNISNSYQIISAIKSHYTFLILAARGHATTTTKADRIIDGGIAA